MNNDKIDYRKMIAKEKRSMALVGILELVLLIALWFLTGGYLVQVSTVDGSVYVLNGTAMVFSLVIAVSIINVRCSWTKIDIYESLLSVQGDAPN